MVRMFSRILSSKSLKVPLNRGWGSSIRYFSSLSQADADIIEADLIVIGAGPAGLSAAIKAKQLANEAGKELNVIVVEKGAEVGAHILSGNCFEPRALDELFPKWKDMIDGRPPVTTRAQNDHFHFLTPNSSFSLPNFLLPAEMHNDGNYIISLGEFCRWMSEQAESIGVDIYSGFPADKPIFDKDGNLTGIQLKDTGIGKDGNPTDDATPGAILRARQFIIAEGARGSLTEALVSHFKLNEDKCPQSYSLGVKEVWRVPKELHQEGLIVHTVGWPLKNDTYGGAFLYHAKDQQIYAGLVVGLDYKNPYISPYEEFQAWKRHPLVNKYFSHPESSMEQYGGRALAVGGIQAMPKLSFPGGMLVGCGAGTLNMPKIKGAHTAMKSGMIAGELATRHLLGLDGVAGIPDLPENVSFPTKDSVVGPMTEISEFETEFKKSWAYDELNKVRNVKPAFKKFGGMAGLMAYAGTTLHVFKGLEPWTFKWNKKDSQATKPAQGFTKPSHYLTPDNKVTFPKLEALAMSNTGHEENQPSHLKALPTPEKAPTQDSWDLYKGVEERFCPAGVYEFIPEEGGLVHRNGQPKMKLQINAQNCIHCKTCAIKTPMDYIKWTVPEGGGGPNYTSM